MIQTSRERLAADLLPRCQRGEAMKRTIVGLLCVSLTACAMSPRYFYENRETLSDSRICRTWISALQQNAPASYTFDIGQEADRRGYTLDRCSDKVAKENTAAAIVGGAALVGAAIAASRRSGGGAVGGGASTVQDYEWDWDEFFDASYRLVWACRGVQTGQFAEQWHCNGKAQTDWRWPSKRADTR